jgi:hypothetical protein
MKRPSRPFRPFFANLVTSRQCFEKTGSAKLALPRPEGRVHFAASPELH